MVGVGWGEGQLEETGRAVGGLEKGDKAVGVPGLGDSRDREAEYPSGVRAWPLPAFFFFFFFV